MRDLFLVALLCLTGCAAKPEPKIEIRTVNIPVAVPCKVDIGEKPKYPDTDEALISASNILERAMLVMAGRILRIQREIELEAAINGCAGEGH